ncbi:MULTISPECIES: DUF3177 family protein [Synechocystis]|nr:MULTISPECIES: DUF3177 family protein [Synechocystis]
MPLSFVKFFDGVMEVDGIWLRLIWLDYRLAVIVSVFIPLVLVIWSAFKRVDAINRLLIIYWRVASLLMVTVYLLIPGWSLAFFTGFAARCLIPVSLWFWVDLNDEIKDLPPSPLKLATTTWRWGITIFSCFAILVNIPFLSCGLNGIGGAESFCQVWLQPPLHYKAWFHANSNTGFLGFLGIIGLVAYVIYFLSFLVFRLGRQGRSALDH